MPELIDKDKLKTAICVACANGIIESKGCESEDCAIQKLINDQPAIESEPVRHGCWIDGTSRGSYSIYCSYCGSQKETICPSEYCPACGAHMDECVDEDGQGV